MLKPGRKRNDTNGLPRCPLSIEYRDSSLVAEAMMALSFDSFVVSEHDDPWCRSPVPL